MKRYQYKLTKRLEETFKLNWETIPNVLKEMTRIFKKNKIDFCVLGGIAVSAHGYERMTTDLDILVDFKDKEKLNSLTGIYFKPAFQGSTKSFIWNDPKVKIDVIFSGEKAGGKEGFEYPYPPTISSEKENVPVIDLKNLMYYKLAVGLYGKNRLKDIVDAQQLIAVNKLPKNFADRFPIELKNKYNEIWNEDLFSDKNWNEE